MPRKDFELAHRRRRSSRPAARSRRRASTTSISASKATSACRRSRAAPTSSPASRSAARRARSGAASCSAAASGCDVDVYDESGRPVAGEKGELVCTAPFPSMPIGFWNDPDGAKYHAAYFERFPGVWCHGDCVELTEHDGLIIYGRSDATLNPGGVRIGTAEIYRQVEQLPKSSESLVIGQDWPPGEVGDVRVVLFVKLRRRHDARRRARRAHQARRSARTRRRATCRRRCVQVTDIPRTKSNKIVELAVRNVVHGRDVKNVEALANPEALEQYRDREELKT